MHSLSSTGSPKGELQVDQIDVKTRNGLINMPRQSLTTLH